MGGVDKLVDPDIGYDMIKRCPVEDKEHLFYPNMWHNILSEEEILDILPKICLWLKKRI